MNTVIRSPNWIGDGIMALPAIRAFKEFFPADRLTIVAKHYLADIFLNISEIDHVIDIPDRWSAPAYLAHVIHIKDMHFERGILFTNSFSSALFFRLAGIHSLSGYDRDARGWLLMDKIPNRTDNQHHQFYYLRIIEHLAGQKIAHPFPSDLIVDDAEKSRARNLLSGLGIASGRDLLAIAPAAAYGDAKTWLPERFREVIMAWQASYPEADILLLGSQGEKNKIERILASLPGRIHNLAGRLTLRETIIILAHCRLVICNDSGLMHVASSLNVPLLAIFGPTDSTQTSPLGNNFRLLHHGADCAPCRHRECPTDHRCMAAISSNEVLTAAEALWNLPGIRKN
ncbi:MAG: lipopolysaccharide heptosyltransferase II [Candidatus Aminicenantes bacterium]|nr:lipopolysaccharide heptosyltransferase II [Candidatus Aminicenantes bacterium]